MLNEQFQCIYATRNPTEYQIYEIEKVCHSWVDLPEDESHFDVFLNFLQGNEIVVLDNYFFTTDYQRAIKAKGCKLVCIDDMHDKHYVADVVINHALTIRDVFSTESYTMLLIGFDYALLRSSFLQEEKEKKEKPNINFQHALICYGGADFNNLTYKTLDNLSEIDSINKITIVIGNAYQQKQQLENKISLHSENKTIKLYQGLNAEELKKIINHVDFGIVPCSTILLEAISQKLPVITGFYVDNQKELASQLIGKFNQILVIGDLNNQNVVHKHIEILNKNTFEKNYEPLITANVKKNILKEFTNLNKEFSLHIRRALKGDSDVYFNWANDKDVRNNAINANPIQYQKHINWYNKKITDINSFLYIFEQNNKPVGQIRFDKEDCSFTIDYSIDKYYRGLGLGSIIIKQGVEKLLKELISNSSFMLVAHVKEENIASAKVFEKMNFKYTDTKIIDEYKYLVFQKKLK